MAQIRMSEEAFSYLSIQAGHVSHTLAQGRDAWALAYMHALELDYEQLKPYVSDHVTSVLDIGSGLGGLDVLIYKRHRHPKLTLLDGMRDKPDVVQHDRTFSNAAVARRFLLANGVGHDDYHFIDPERPVLRNPKQSFDFVYSLRSWCFHYEPMRYLPLVMQAVHSNTWIVVDIRRQRPDWKQQMLDAFGLPWPIHAAEKYERLAFRVR